MRAINAAVAVNLRKCVQGHRITNGKGKCLQCYPGQLIFIRRWMEQGFVYLAESKRLALIKVGTCKNLDERELSLNQHTYGGSSDWVMKTWVESSHAGQLEHKLTLALKDWREEIEYDRYWKQTYGKELFCCTYRRANAEFKRLCLFP